MRGKCTDYKHLDPLPLSLQVPNEPLQSGEAVLHRSIVSEEQASVHMRSVLADLL